MFFSVIMAVYSGTNISFFRDALESVYASIKQSGLTPKEIEVLIGVDGKVSTAFTAILVSLESQSNGLKTRVAWFDRNRGLGPTLADLVSIARGKYCIRMDDDDIMNLERVSVCSLLHISQGFELVSSPIQEFSTVGPDNAAIRDCAKSLKELSRFVRNPLNHVATSFKTSAILRVGNYRDVKYFEDWNLWMRCTELTFCRYDKPLVRVRTGSEMIGRRVGFQYVLCELGFLRSLFGISLRGALIFLAVLPLRVGARLLPYGPYKFLLHKVLRSRRK